MDLDTKTHEDGYAFIDINFDMISMVSPCKILMASYLDLCACFQPIRTRLAEKCNVKAPRVVIRIPIFVKTCSKTIQLATSITVAHKHRIFI